MGDSASMGENEFIQNTIEATIRLGLLLLLATWCFKILTPFIVPVMWGVVIAVAIYPLFLKLKSVLGGRNKLASIVCALVTLAFLMIPAVMISDSVINTSKQINDRYGSGVLAISPPKESVKQWPLIGEKTYATWSLASRDPKGILKKYEVQIKKAGEMVVSAAAGAGGNIVQFIISIIISGFFLANASAAYAMTIKIISRLTNDGAGQAYTELLTATIRSVAQGVLGVALVQAVLSGLGMFMMDVPAWGLWTLVALVLAVAQLPIILILGPVSAYVFSVTHTTPAILFLIYCLIISVSDSFLKPLFLGRGTSTPMLVILLGAIGGMLMSGIIGLFVGAIVLALGYELFMAWLNRTEMSTQ